MARNIAVFADGIWESSEFIDRGIEIVNKGMVIVAFMCLVSASFAADNIHQNITLSASTRHLIALAKQGDPKAQTCLGEMYAMGMDVKRDATQAMSLYQKAAKQGYLRAKWAIAATQIWNPNNYSQAVKLIRGFADQGYAPAEEQIGQMYLYSGSDKYEQNYERALEWFRKSASQGYPEAEADMGLVYRHGWGVKANRVEAKLWATKAADHQIECGPEIVPLILKLIAINADYPQDVLDGKIHGRATVKLYYIGKRFTHPTLVTSSGNKELDKVAIKTMMDTQLPRWVGMGPYVIVTVDLTQEWAEPVLMSQIKTAIRRSMIMPKHVLIYGSKGADVAIVSFEYRDGHVSQVKIEKSSGDSYVDNAALKAVSNARYPKTPVKFSSKTIHFSVPINFAVTH